MEVSWPDFPVGHAVCVLFGNESHFANHGTATTAFRIFYFTEMMISMVRVEFRVWS